MKKQIQRIALIVVCLGASAAWADDGEKLKESQQKWEQARDKADGDYSYTVAFNSFSGFGHVTEIVVRDNKVAERRYREFNVRTIEPAAPGEAPKYDWVEKGEALGSHKEGAAVKTIDELYQEAAAVLKRELPAHQKLYLQFDKQGLLKACFTVDTRIADDAPSKGVKIANISLGGDQAARTYKAPNGKPFPAHWGEPPRRQTRDLRPLPGGYGRGSGTLARWIAENMKRDAEKKNE